MTLRCVYPHLQSSTHFQQRTPYLTSEPSVSDRPFSPKILPPPCWCSLLSQLKIWQLFHMALESTLKHLAWRIRPCATCHLRLQLHLPACPMSYFILQGGGWTLSHSLKESCWVTSLASVHFPTTMPESQSSFSFLKSYLRATLLGKLC